MSLDKTAKLKVSGMLAAVIIVIGVTVIISNSAITGSGGVSADVEDIATGRVIMMPQEIYHGIMADLNTYFKLRENQEEQDKLIQDIVDSLNGLVD